MIISLNIPDAIATRVINGICGQNNYQAEIPDPTDPEGTKMMPNPETKPIFAKRMIRNFIKENVKSYEANKDAEIARTMAVSKADNEINIT